MMAIRGSIRISCAWSALLALVWLSPVSAGPNFVKTENLKPGTAEWKLTKPGRASGVIEGYASLTSVNRGGEIRFFVNTAAPTYTIDIFRMGYYGGLGGRRMLPTISRPGTIQPPPITDATTGLIECEWGHPYVLDIPNNPSDPTDWMSGIYLVKLTASPSGTQQYIIFTVRDDSRFTDLIFAQTVTTYQAYNPWGGKSLYGDLAHRDDHAFAAHKVSFNRPYYGDSTSGASNLFSWEAATLRWLEAEGYDVSYATNIDVDRDANLLLTHKGFLSVGHDEYWTWNMVDHVEGARDRGINLGFFSGNTAYWQARFEPSIVDNAPDRTLVSYKNDWLQDPITPDYLKTNYFRRAPVNRSEDAMEGVMFVTQARPLLVVEDASHWVFTGTGLANGDRVARSDGTSFLGYEVDAMGPRSPANAQRLAHSPVNARAANFSDITVYRASSGATVFAIGSIGWSTVVPQVQQITRNVLARFVNGAFADTTPVRPPLPTPFVGQDLGDVGRPGFVSAAGAQSFTLNGAGQNTRGGTDALYYAYQMLSGDGQMIARLNALQLFWDNRAGLMIRESLAADARYVALVGRPSESVGTLVEGVELWSRATIGTKRTVLAAMDAPLPNWLKLTRTGDTFASFVSADGLSWTPIGSTSMPMGRDVFIGAEVSSAQHGVWATASFDNVTVSRSGSSGSACATVTLDRSAMRVGSTEANWIVNVTAPNDGCAWTAISDAAWLVVKSTNPALPAGSGYVKLRAIANTGISRQGHVTINGAVHTVTQGQGSSALCTDPAALNFNGPLPCVYPPPGACPSLTLTNPHPVVGATEANWYVPITAPTATCTWTATTDQPWLLINGSSVAVTGAGSGRIKLKAVTNTSTRRVGHITINGMVLTITQG